jgi:DNA polymerase III epsilon subunit-like protein
MVQGISPLRIDDTPIAIIDFETSGLTAGADRVVEVSVVRVDPGEEPRLVLSSAPGTARCSKGSRPSVDLPPEWLFRLSSSGSTARRPT